MKKAIASLISGDVNITVTKDYEVYLMDMTCEAPICEKRCKNLSEAIKECALLLVSEYAGATHKPTQLVNIINREVVAE